MIKTDRGGPGGDQPGISWNGQSGPPPPTTQAPTPSNTGSSTGGLTGSDWNRPSESHSGITWGGGKMVNIS